MRAKSCRATTVGRLIALLLMAAATGSSGCGLTSPDGRTGLRVVAGDGWTSVPVSDVMVPGSVISAWSGPEGASLVAFTSLPIPSPDAGALGREMAIRWLNLPGVTVEGSSEVTYSGLKAARVEAVGPGTGSAFAPSGIGTPVAPKGKTLIPTRRITVVFPRGGDTLTLEWHFPDSSRAAITPMIESTLRSVRVTDTAGPTYSY
jgi:hypothetical protein